MDAIAISAKKLSKTYRVYNNPKDMLAELVTGKSRHQDLKVLDDISLVINKGEVVGIIGSNGAGKSTLLKILAGTLNKTAGDFQINGRVSAILELGTGFHPEYTGRENIYLGGMCLGMTRDEIDSKLESIINFSELRDVIDRPFKTYSSGMMARLTFSTAISVEPDIFIIDEALAAGDAIFVNKCLSRIRKICMSNTTVLFVSHSTDMVRQFCSQAFWLEKGKVIMHGSSDTVTKGYDRYVYEQSHPYLQSTTVSAKDLVETTINAEYINGNVKQEIDSDNVIDQDFFKYGSKEIQITKVETCNADGVPDGIFYSGDFFEIRVYHTVGTIQHDDCIRCSIQIFTKEGLAVLTSNSSMEHKDFDSDPDNDLFYTKSELSENGYFRMVLDPLLLGPGNYLIAVGIYSLRNKKKENTRWLDFHDRSYEVVVKNRKWPTGTRFIIQHPAKWSYSKITTTNDIGIVLKD